MGESHEGFVYFLSSPKIAGIKIGGTSIGPAHRLRSLNGSLPYSEFAPWAIVDFVHCHDWRVVERMFHLNFSSKQMSTETTAREIFHVSAFEARQAIESLERNMIKNYHDIDKMFERPELAFYLERLFTDVGLKNWIGNQEQWTLSLFPRTGGGRFFTLNVGPHEVAFSGLPDRDGVGWHGLVVDPLLLDIEDTVRWIYDRKGVIENAPYATALSRASRVAFMSTLDDAFRFLALPGVRRALIAYWTDALIECQKRGRRSVYARYHNYNATAFILRRIENNNVFSVGNPRD